MDALEEAEARAKQAEAERDVLAELHNCACPYDRNLHSAWCNLIVTRWKKESSECTENVKSC